MDLATVGAFCLVGHMITRYFRKDDDYKVFDTIMLFVGLFLIFGSKHHFFG